MDKELGLNDRLRKGLMTDLGLKGQSGVKTSSINKVGRSRFSCRQFEEFCALVFSIILNNYPY
jgi:hypothetical protein